MHDKLICNYQDRQHHSPFYKRPYHQNDLDAVILR